MVYYADASWWLALTYRPDINHKAAWRLFVMDQEATVLWTPWHRVEVYNVFYQMERLGHFERGDAIRAIRQTEAEIQVGFWKHREFSWTNAIRKACQLSKTHGRELPVRGMDLFHVAVALTVRARVFLTFDNDQKVLAAAAGLATSPPLKISGGSAPQ